MSKKVLLRLSWITAFGMTCVLSHSLAKSQATNDPCTSTCGDYWAFCNVNILLSSPWWSPAPPHIKWLSHTKIGIDVGSASAPGWFDDETELTTTAATRWGSCASTSFAVGGGSAHEIVWITSQADWLSEVGNANALASTQFVARDETGHVTGTETLVNVAFFGDADWGDELFGLDPDEVSFSGVMTHELGHVVGFSWPSHPDTVCEGCTVMIGVIQAGDHQTFEKLGRLDTEAMLCLYGAPGEQATFDDSWAVQGRPEDPYATDSFLRRKLQALQEFRTERSKSVVAKMPGHGQPYVIFTTSLLATDVQSYVADYWEDKGYDATVVDVSTYPTDQDEFRATLKAAIASFASSGVEYFHLIGDSNDWREFDIEQDLWSTLWGAANWPTKYDIYTNNYSGYNYPAEGQRARDLIPTYTVPDTLPRGDNMAWYTPYWHSDQNYADVDDDGVPDVVLTRWPVATASDLLAMAFKMQTYNDVSVPTDYHSVAFYVGNVDHTTGELCVSPPCRDGRLAMDHADSVEARLNEIAPGQYVDHLYQRDYMDEEERNCQAVHLWNTFRPDVAIIFSSWSDRYYPGDFFNETCSNPFNMGQITSNILALVIGATCSTADWVWTEDPDFDKPPCEDFLTDWDAGAIAWIGPSKGSYGQASFRVTLYTVEEIFQNQQRPMAESWLIAMQRLYANFPNHLRFHNTFNEYVFLGDPLSPMLRPDAVTAADGSYVPSDVTLQCTPNPFNPRTRIDFSIVNRGLVSLRIYDVKGVMIRELVSKNMDPGEYFVEWGGDDGRGNAAGSGVYFCRLTSSGRSVVRKIVLLK